MQTNEGLVSTGADGLIWTMLAAPILVIACLLNSIWLAVTLRHRSPRDGAALLISTVVWTCLVAFEIYVRGQAVQY